MSTEPTTIRWEQDETGVVTLVLDDPNQSANTMNQAFRASLAAITDRLEAEKDSIRGVIFTSAKKTFFAGGDLRDLIRVTPATAQDLFDGGLAIKRNLRRIETLGKPVVAAINGAALGGGFELALACHHRIALDTPGTKIGCPEVTLGLLPGGGGVVRTVRLLGIADALLKVLLQGTQYNATRARENGLVHEVAAGTSRNCSPRRAPSSTPTPSPSSPTTSRATASRAAPRPTRSSRPTCPRSRPTCASRPTARPTRPRAASSPPPSRAPRSTSRRPRSSRPATSSSWPRARPRRT